MALEQNIHALWAAFQSAKGTPATAPALAANGQRFRLADQGAIAVARQDGSGPFNDLDIFGDAQDYVQTLSGQGSPPIHGTPDELAWLCLFLNGQETVNDIVGPPAKKEHVGTPTPSLKYASFWQRVGSSVIERLRHVDCIANTLEITNGNNQHILRVTPGVISLDPGEKIAADPALGMPAAEAFLWTESEGAVLLNGTVIEGPTVYTLTLNKNLELIYANAVTPHDVQPGTPTIGVQVGMVLDQDAFELANSLLYGDPTPAAGDKPVAFIGGLGAFDVTHTQKDEDGADTGNIAQFEVPGVRWQAPSAVAVPNVAGGGGTLELTGAMRKVAGQPAWRSTVTCDEVAFTA